MAKALDHTRDAIEDFLDWERRQEPRYEFHDGEVRMMVGGKAAHHRIVYNLRSALTNRLPDGPCEAFDESMKVRTERHVLYPDVFVSCKPLPDESDVTEDPVIVAEVLSPSTADIDRGRKWEIYRSIGTVRHYVLVAQDEVHVAVYTRDGERWVYEELRGRSTVLRLTHPITFEIPLAELYKGTSVPD